MKYCSNCGNQVNDDSLFCPKCGSKINNSVGASGDAGIPEAANNTGQNYGSAYGQNPNQNYGSAYNQNYGQGYGYYGNQSTVSELSLFEYFKKCFRHYADFNGRARRKEYWGYVLFYMIFYVVAYIIFSLIDNLIDAPVFTSILGLASLGAVIPSIAVAVRRLHDIGKSGWWYFISFIPLVGAIWMLVLLCTEGTRGMNAYGPATK